MFVLICSGWAQCFLCVPFVENNGISLFFLVEKLSVQE